MLACQVKYKYYFKKDRRPIHLSLPLKVLIWAVVLIIVAGGIYPAFIYHAGIFLLSGGGSGHDAEVRNDRNSNEGKGEENLANLRDFSRDPFTNRNSLHCLFCCCDFSSKHPVCIRGIKYHDG